MYGMIYVTIKDYAEAAYGDAAWQEITSLIDRNISFTATDQPYSEENIYYLAGIVAKQTGDDINKVLYGFGYRTPETIVEKYPEVMASRGDSLQEYLVNLPAFHNRMSLIYPQLKAPEFRIIAVTENSIEIEYQYKLEEILPYVLGYLAGLSQHFKKDSKVTAVPEKSTRRTLVFNVSW
ncbi:heme NO-binding domain-containing protein [Flavobacterium sp. RHBU_3]|uniref:heme NO-binding domain-containing protein n=1 Tax=Flavobacterium sp. RHBU_3 TaxID=3391184 RepID=UPI003984F94A